MIHFTPFIQPFLPTLVMVGILFIDGQRIIQRRLPFMALFWILALICWTLFNWSTLIKEFSGGISSEAWSAFFLGLIYGTYGMMLARLVYGGAADRKVEQVFLKAAILCGLLLMTLANFRSLELSIVICGGLMLLGLPVVYQREELKWGFNFHAIAAFSLVMFYLLSRNELLDQGLLHWGQGSFLMISLIAQYIVIRKVSV
jgi:hypothetical protein